MAHVVAESGPGVSIPRGGLSSEVVLGAMAVGLAIHGALALRGAPGNPVPGWIMATACGWAWLFIGRRFVADVRGGGVERDVVVFAAGATFLLAVGTAGALTIAAHVTDLPSLQVGPVFIALSTLFFASEIVIRRRLAPGA